MLQRHNLRVSYNGRLGRSVAGQLEHRSTCGACTFIQPAGPSNVLGVVKFRFPNKHDVYMHDTPQRELFDKHVRTFSHGCIRVHNPGTPRRAAARGGQGLVGRSMCAACWRRGGYNNEVELTKQIPVHVTYFTAVVGEDGQVQLLRRHLRPTTAASRRRWAAEPLPPEARWRARRVPRPQAQARKGKAKQKSNDFLSGLFGN